MGDAKKHKSPEELGDAVGQKIDELFGGLFEDDTTQVTQQSAEDIPMVSTTVARVEPEPAGEPAEEQPAPRSESIRVETPPPDSAEAFLDKLEALILDLEWEMNYKTVQQLAHNFENLLKRVPSVGPAKTAFEMSQRVLERFSDPGSSPHPLLVKLLHDSVAVIRDTMSPQAVGNANQTLMANLAGTYKQIMAGPKEVVPAAPLPQPQIQGPSMGDVLRDVEPVISSLEQLSQRLTKTLEVWRDAGELSVDEITMRLGKLDSLLSEKINFLGQTLKKVDRSGSGTAGGIVSGLNMPDEHKYPDGLLLIAWYSKPLAIPSTIISAFIPLAEGQAQQLVGKKTIALGNLELSKLPLSKPKTAKKKPDPIPSWLIHVSVKGREFFILADRALGFRRPPPGVDLSKESRIKIGNVSYTVLNPDKVRLRSS